LDKLKRSIDACSNPPYFRGVSTPITDLLGSAEPKVAKQKRDQTKTKAEKTKDNKANPTPNETAKGDHKHPHLTRRPAHEQPSKLPEGLKRPDLDATVDGKKIASESQRQLYDDLKRGNCTRCHKGGHIRKDCTEPKAKWEDKFDKEKTQLRLASSSGKQKLLNRKLHPETRRLPLSTSNPNLKRVSKYLPADPNQTKTQQPFATTVSPCTMMTMQTITYIFPWSRKQYSKKNSSHPHSPSLSFSPT
jgi:hypothetical protein